MREPVRTPRDDVNLQISIHDLCYDGYQLVKDPSLDLVQDLLYDVSIQ